MILLIIYIIDVLAAKVSAHDGYLIINWAVPKKDRFSNTSTTYNISLCSKDDVPTLCKKYVFTMCSATYNPSNSSGKLTVWGIRSFGSGFAIGAKIGIMICRAWNNLGDIWLEIFKFDRKFFSLVWPLRWTSSVNHAVNLYLHVIIKHKRLILNRV